MSLDPDETSAADQLAVSSEPQGKRARNRAENEERILDAFERIMVRDGIRGVGPNAIMEEAGLGKPLLYTYFGDLNGLIRAWGERRKLWPDNEDLDQQVMMPGDAANRFLYDGGWEQLAARLKQLADRVTTGSIWPDEVQGIRSALDHLRWNQRALELDLALEHIV